VRIRRETRPCSKVPCAVAEKGGRPTSDLKGRRPGWRSVFDELCATRPRFHGWWDGSDEEWGLTNDVLEFLVRQLGPTSRTLETGCGLSTVVCALRSTSHTSVTPFSVEIE